MRSTPETPATVDPLVLDRILLLQTLLYASSDLDHLAELCCSSLLVIPGVEGVELRAEDRVVAAFDASGKLSVAAFEKLRSDFEVLPVRIATIATTFGEFHFAISNTKKFRHYQPSVRSVANLVALIQEGWKRLADLEALNANLVLQLEEPIKDLQESKVRSSQLEPPERSLGQGSVADGS